MEHLTPNQQRAIQLLDRSCVVTAGPGAGKTRVLVERVLNILRGGQAELDQIVAITFTNKAANEMKERIRRELTELSQTATSTAEARHWHELAQRLEEAAISTFHGFCASVLRAHPVEAQVDPAFAILDEYTSRLLLYQVVEEVINHLVDIEDETAARFVTGYSRMGLIEHLAELYFTTRTLGLELGQVEQLTRQHLGTTDDYRAALERLNATINQLTALDKLPPKAREQVEALGEAWRHYRSLLPTEPRIEEAPFFDECLEALAEAKVEKRANAVKELAAALEQQINEVGELFYDVCTRQTLGSLIRILEQIDRNYQAAKAQANGLDYEDLQLKTRSLLRTYPYLARRYGERYRFMLVDEFQDTNQLQKDIIDLLMSGAASVAAQGTSPAVNLFIVADAKQSIYNFRGAAVEVFTEAARHVREQGGVELVLEKNFRSTASLVRFFNEFFSRLMTPDPDQPMSSMQRLGYVEFIPSEADRPESPHPPVELILEIGQHVKNLDEGREREAERIAERIVQMVHTGECLVGEPSADGQPSWRPVRYGDIAMLFRAMTDIKTYERALRQRGIPYYVLAGRGFYEREEIQDVLSLLRVLENRTDEIALVAALRSPLFGLSDNTLYWLHQYAQMRSGGGLEHHPMLSSLLDYQGAWGIAPEQSPLVARAAEVLAQLLDRRNRIPLADLLQQIIEATHFDAIQATFYDGHQRVANLQKLVELARNFQASGPHVLRDFIQFIRQFTEMETREGEAPIEGGNQDVVQIMTIHKAKGLEFPIVIIPDLMRKRRTQAPALAFDRALGIGLKEPDRRGRPHQTRMRRRVEEYIEWREYFESQRLLFVAATRAMDYLILAGAAPETKDRDSWPDAPLRKATSWLQWLCAILEITDAQSLPQTYQWNGIPLRITRREAPTAETPEAPSRLIDRFTEIRQAQAIPANALPQLDDEGQQVLASLCRLIEPIKIEPLTSAQPLAVTRLLSVARCPLQYYYESVLGLPALDEYEPDFKPQTSDLEAQSLSVMPRAYSPTTRGTIVHRFCERYDGSEPWEPVLQQLVEEAVTTADTDDLQTARQRVLADVKPLVEHYLSSELWKEIEQILWGGKPGRVESELEFLYHTGSIPLRGRIDKLLINSQGRVTIIDFKTNRVTAQQVETVAREYELQLQIYAAAARHAWPSHTVRAELYFLHPNVRWEIPAERLEESQTIAQLRELSEQVLRIRHVDDATPYPSPERCRSCQCFSFCPARAADTLA
ncbi:MAG: UvrD-helicase domain-containing protein [Acidobacteriota bacterium]|nr:UvrD-helicase domain-containing protein [Blastocatellia bacterium]MDW8241121.1 UvrD-helicase domain-containing protein [Acidobacteriota bacterium]